MSATETLPADAIPDERPLMVMEVVEPSQCPWAAQGVVDRVQRWVGNAYWQLLSHHKGHIVRHLGNGLMMEFADARQCMKAAFALNQMAESLDAKTGCVQPLRIRAAAHLASYVHPHREPEQRDVRLTTELTTVAAPGEVLVTAELRDRLTDGLDADFEDLGHWVETFAQPVRLFKANPQGDESICRTARNIDLRPGLAVIPFKAHFSEASHRMVGELIADGVIARLSHSVGLRVISRHSTSAFQDNDGLVQVEHLLGAHFVLSGTYAVGNEQLTVVAELVEVRSHALLWTGHVRHPLNDLLEEESELLHELAQAVGRALGHSQVNSALVRPVPSLDSSCLMLAGISMVHSHSGKIFERGREALTALTLRHPDLALPRAWLAMWHALNVVKGRSGNTARDIHLAREQTMRALEAEPANAMALAVDGYIQCQLLGDPQRSRELLMLATKANPSEPMAWLFRSLLSGGWGSSSLAVTEAQVAMSLSPVDPLQYFFELLAGNAMLADRRLEQAIAYGRKSLRAHKHHVPTLRLLLTAHAELGQVAEGKDALDQLLALTPDLTVSSYLAMGSADSPMRQRMAQAMRQLGLPES